jgi:hypothetical protein
VSPPRPNPYGPADYGASAALIACACGAFALAATADAARFAVGWWSWSGTRRAIETPPPAGGRNGR